MSNFLFANISSIFQAPSSVLETINKLDTAKEEKKRTVDVDVSGVTTDESGKVQVSNEIVVNKTSALFTDEKMVEVTDQLQSSIAQMEMNTAETFINKVAETAAKTVIPKLETVKQQFENVRKADLDRMQKTIHNKVQEKTREYYLAFDKKQAEIKRNYEEKVKGSGD